MTTTEKNLQEQIHELIRYLAGNCDGAKEIDDAGFNKFDAPVGHELANQESLSPAMVKIGARLARKYRKQLESAGYSLPDFTGIDGYIATLPAVPATPTIEKIPPQQENKTTSNLDKITLSGEQQAIFELMEKSKQHLFITGRAGTGKSVLLRHFRENTKKRVVVCAPTGIAALNVKGQTIHSLFKLGIGLHQPGDLFSNSRAESLLRRVDTVVIDEISMVRADVLDAIDERLRLAFENDAPFGGAQVIMFGDVYQLSPVVDEGLLPYFGLGELPTGMEPLYKGQFFFNALVWKHAEFKIFELSQVFRQKDPAFRDILNAVRDGTVTQDQIAHLNKRYNAPVPTEGTITLAASNSLVTEINKKKLDQLPGKLFKYQAEITGEMKRSVFPTEENLFLREKAQVVLLKNDANGRWVNGTVGIIEKLEEKKIDVRIAGITYSLEKETWEEITYSYNEKTKRIEGKTASSFTQYPVRLAWALTVHKSQGQTYESVALDLSSPMFATGQMYVALSRATSIEGLYLAGKQIKREDIKVDANVIEFMARRETIIIEAVEPVAAAPIIIESTLVPQEEIIPEPITPVIEADPVQEEEIVHTELQQRNPRGAGRKRKEDLVRVNIKLSKRQQTLTENIDRSELIRKLLNAHLGIEE